LLESRNTLDGIAVCCKAIAEEFENRSTILEYAPPFVGMISSRTSCLMQTGTLRQLKMKPNKNETQPGGDRRKADEVAVLYSSRRFDLPAIEAAGNQISART
jgi:hypothetical protein